MSRQGFLFAIDPGTESSAIVSLAPNGEVRGAMWKNSDLLLSLRRDVELSPSHLVIESIESYGMPVGREVFETVFWSGRFAEAWQSRGLRDSWSRLPRRDVKLHLCGSPRAKDANIRQALIDKYGGVACTKKGGALYGIKSHLWSALALAVTFRDTKGGEQ